MKHCPTCNRDYSDDSLSFCLDDGSPLTVTGTAGGSGYDPNATLTYNTGRPTDPRPTAGMGAGGFAPPPNPTWRPAPPPARKSNALWWVLGIGGVFVVGVGVLLLVGVIGFATLNSGTENKNSSNTNGRQSQNENKNPLDTINDDGRKLVLKDDFSEQKWYVNSSEIGSSSYMAGSYQMTGPMEKYFVTYGPSQDYRTDENTTVKVTVRNVTSKSTTRGYGVAVFGHVADGQATDYAFLIINGDTPKFSVVLHRTGTTTMAKDWASASSIRTGTTPNQLEVKITKGQIAFYINGQFATSLTNSAGFTDGLVGLCVHDSYPVAFDDLEIYR